MSAKYIPTQELLNRDILTYRDILNIKSRLNGYRVLKSRGEGKDANDFEWKDEYKITADHSKKGLDWLHDVAIKPTNLDHVLETGDWTDEDIRISNPLGHRELTILVNFDHFTFTGLYDAQSSAGLSMGYHNYLPIWRAYDHDGDSFEYYVQGHDINIIG
jgi:hypothetical protein